MATRSKLPENIKAEIENIFTQCGLPCPYILYRTVMFEGESPHNLLPSQRQPNKRVGWTVFLVFEKAPPIIANLDKIIAFPDQADSMLRRLKKIRTGRQIKNIEKVDLSLFKKVNKRFVFGNLEKMEEALKKDLAGFFRDNSTIPQTSSKHSPKKWNYLRHTVVVMPLI